jgi:predicted amidohydrolase YtcJ
MVRQIASLLIRDAEIFGHGRADVLVEHGRIARIGQGLACETGRVIEARGGLLLPGLHDHHIHLAGLAVRAQSVWCGPPQVTNEAQLREALATAPGPGWIRGIGYHESVLGELPDARALDTLVADRPMRMQHRSGRMWLLNSLALELLLAENDPPPGLEGEYGRYTGRLFDADEWLRGALGSTPPDFAAISAELARLGVTGVTDMTPQNGPDMAAHFASQRASGALVQSVTLAGTLDLADAPQQGWTLGPVKLHLHEAQLPSFDDAAALIRTAHDQGRAVAIHCVSEVEIVFALALLEHAEDFPGDRIEHASIASPDHIARMTELGLAVCVQPHFVAERGDRYLVDVEPSSHPHLYRLASLSAAGIALAGGSDAPFAGHDPWAAMRAGVSRRTAAGETIGVDEALTPEQALALWLADPADLSRQRDVAQGAPADLCLLARPWAEAGERLANEDVILTLASGQIVHDRVDQPPVERSPR